MLRARAITHATWIYTYSTEQYCTVLTVLTGVDYRVYVGPFSHHVPSVLPQLVSVCHDNHVWTQDNKVTIRTACKTIRFHRAPEQYCT